MAVLSLLTARGGRVRQVPRTRLGLPTLLPMTRLPALPPHRKRENSLQEDRGSFVTTPTAELSSQEETLLGSFLDWSLDYCSGYEGDQESEGEKEGDGECQGWRPPSAAPEGTAGRRAPSLSCRRVCPDTGRHERAEPLEYQPTGRIGCGPNLRPAPAGPVLVEGPHQVRDREIDLSRRLCEMCPLLGSVPQAPI